MSYELKEIKKESKKEKSYSELLKEYKSLLTKTADVYIPDLFNALREEHPDWNLSDYKAKIIKDLQGINTERTIKLLMPSWMKNPNKSRAQEQRKKNEAMAKKLSKEREEEERKEREEQQKREQAREKMQESTKDIPESQNNEEESETIGKGVPLEQWQEQHPEIEPSALQRLGEINGAYKRLWRALTNKDDLPSEQDDFKTEHLIPTREFRKDIVKGNTDPLARKFLWNYSIWIKTTIEDLITIMEKEK